MPSCSYVLSEKWEQLFENVHRTISLGSLALACGGFNVVLHVATPEEGERTGSDAEHAGYMRSTSIKDARAAACCRRLG
jgi:hypothetical protein